MYHAPINFIKLLLCMNSLPLVCSSSPCSKCNEAVTTIIVVTGLSIIIVSECHNLCFQTGTIGGCFIILSVLVVLGGILVLYWKEKSKKKQQNTFSMQENNAYSTISRFQREAIVTESNEAYSSIRL